MSTIREELEAREREMLSPYAQRACESKGTRYPRKGDDLRTAYMQDRDRIVHSEAFRRLKDKTQVILSSTQGAFRTRLTHTLEVTQIARTIARALRLNEDLTEAIGLGHDLGHTPFGHSGEKALAKLLPHGFHHSRHSLRVVDDLEKGRGLNLSEEVRDGILKHTKGKGKILNEANRPMTLEGEVVRICDSIAYINADIDDAIRYTLLRREDLPRDVIAVLGDRYSTRINTMVLSVIKASEGQPHIAMEDEILDATEALRAFMFANVYESAPLAEERERVGRIVSDMFHYFKGNPERLDDHDITTKLYDDLDERVTDFIAHRTDRELLNIYLKTVGYGAFSG